MPVISPDTKVAPVAQKLMACLTEAVLANPKPPKVVGFRTGTDGQPLGADHGGDECCQGAAFIRVFRTFPSWSVPTPSEMAVRCAQPHAVEFEISMWRCAPVGTMSQVPVQRAWDEVHMDLLNDRATMMAAVCCFIRGRDAGSTKYGEWLVAPTEGACVGSSLLIQADLYGRST